MTRPSSDSTGSRRPSAPPGADGSGFGACGGAFHRPRRPRGLDGSRRGLLVEDLGEDLDAMASVAGERRERLQRRRRAGQADGRDLDARARMPSKRRALEAPVAGALVEQHQRQRVLEQYSGQLERGRGRDRRVARSDRALVIWGLGEGVVGVAQRRSVMSAARLTLSGCSVLSVSFASRWLERPVGSRRAAGGATATDPAGPGAAGESAACSFARRWA